MTFGSSFEVVWKVSRKLSASSWATAGPPVSPKLEGTSATGVKSRVESTTCQSDVRLKPLPVSRLPATKRTPCHSNIAGDSIGSNATLPHGQVSRCDRALQDGRLAPLA